MSTDGDLTGLFGVDDTNNANDLVLYNQQTQTLSLVTFDYGGGNIANAGSSGGRVFVADDNTPYVLFNSNASNLISGGADSNNVSDVFLRNMISGFTNPRLAFRHRRPANHSLSLGRLFSRWRNPQSRLSNSLA